MATIINRTRYLILIFCFCFSIYSINFYEGSKYIFIIYNIILLFLVYYLTNFSSSFISFFLAFYLFMGFWFKYNFSLVFNNGYVFDSGLMNSTNIDNVLILSIYLFLTIIISNYTSKKFSYNKFRLSNTQNLFSKLYFDYKNYIIFFFVIFFLLNGILNYFFKIYIKGIIFDNEYNYIYVSLIKWLLLYGFIIFSCFILNQELRNKRKNIILLILIIFFELFVSYTSMLSRSIVLFGIPFIYCFIFYDDKTIYFKRNYIFLVLIFLVISSVSIISSNKLRLFHVNQLKEDLRVEYQKLQSNKKNNKENIINSDVARNDLNKNFLNSKKFNFQVNEMLKEDPQKINAKNVTNFILINRWVGIDSLINVSTSDNLSFRLLIEAFKEEKSKAGNSFYENNFNLEHKKISFSSKETYVKGNTLPGLFSFLYYSGSKFFLITLTFLILNFLVYLEKKIFFFSNKNIIFVGFFSHAIANRIFSFGYAPKDTYLFIASLLLSLIFIYILETNRFDKLLSNLK